MPDKNTTNLPILDDIIKAGDTDKAVHQPARAARSRAQAGTPEAQAASTGHSRPAETHPQPEAVEPFLDDIIASYRPNLDSLADEILSEIMVEMEPLLRQKILQTLKRHFPDSGRSE